MASRRTISFLAGVALAAAVVVVVYQVIGGGSRLASRNSSAPRSTASAKPSTTPDVQTTALNPLTIAAMRDRAYPASTLTQLRSDGDQGGYVNTMVSFVSDGLTEDALMSTPDRARPAAGWPVIVICHGYIDPRTYRTDDASYAQFIAAFARAGYLVLKPDYRGHGQSQGVPEGGYLSPVYTYDVLNLVSTLRADPRVDPSRIGLYGHSLGGYEALRAMVVSRDVRAVTFMAGVVGSLDDIFFHWPQPVQPTPPPPPVQQQVARSVIASNGTPQTQPDFYNRASPINYVAASTAAVQINMDVADSEVPKLFSDHLDAALVAAGRSVQYLTYPGDDHQFTANRTAVLANMVAFFRAHL
jgi:dipeptidyl aminopeptidase/acylaminoacyl peptidase